MYFNRDFGPECCSVAEAFEFYDRSFFNTNCVKGFLEVRGRREGNAGGDGDVGLEVRNRTGNPRRECI